MADFPTPLLDIRNLHLGMRSYEGEAHVLNGVNLTIQRGEIWGLAGETGCGKSLTGLSVSRLIGTPPGRYMGGEVRFQGRDLLPLGEPEMRKLRGRHIGMIFQDPSTNLNPVLRIGDQVTDVALQVASHSPELFGLGPDASKAQVRRAAGAKAIEILERVGIANAAQRARDFPHQFSGGMRQRVLIAMALVGEPELLIADEPTTALDVTLQAQILQLLRDLVSGSNTSVLLITHNLGVVAQICSHVAVMYAGHIVESGRTAEVLGAAAHPYTRALLAALPKSGVARGQLANLPGRVPALVRAPPGCRFAPRCARAVPECTAQLPPSARLTDSHKAACIRLDVQVAA